MLKKDRKKEGKTKHGEHALQFAGLMHQNVLTSLFDALASFDTSIQHCTNIYRLKREEKYNRSTIMYFNVFHLLYVLLYSFCGFIPGVLYV